MADGCLLLFSHLLLTRSVQWAGCSHGHPPPPHSQAVGWRPPAGAMPRPQPPQICPGRLESVMESPRLTTPSHVRKSEDDSKFSPMLNLTTSNSDSAGDGAAHNLTGSRITRLSSSENALLSNRHQPIIKDKGVNSSTFLAANPSLSGILLYEGNIRLVQD